MFERKFPARTAAGQPEQRLNFLSTASLTLRLIRRAATARRCLHPLHDALPAFN